MEMFERVVLLVDLPDYDLKAGDVGVIIEEYAEPQGFMLEFNTRDGDLVALPVVSESQIRSLRDDDLCSVRRISEWYGIGSKSRPAMTPEEDGMVA